MTYILVFLMIGVYGLLAQQPFLEVRPYVPPAEEQYPVHASVDHYYPTQTENGMFIRLDGDSAQAGNPPARGCVHGQTCYDGHSGHDIWMPKGVPILAAAGGTVVWAEFGEGVSPCPDGNPPNGDLAVVIIDHGNGYYSTYLHMDSITVTVGQHVNAGDTIAFNGNSGCASVPHLHFEMRRGAYYFDQQKSWVVDPYGWWGTGTDPIRDMRNFTSVWLWKSSDLIDDGDNGFERFYGPHWQRLQQGYNGDAWQVPAKTEGEQSEHMAMWVPELPHQGQYHIQISVPQVQDAVNQAMYKIYVKDRGGSTKQYTVLANQDSIFNQFFTIATLELPAGARCAVFLSDIVPAGTQGSKVVFDAVRFVPATTGINQKPQPENPLRRLEIIPGKPNPVHLSSQQSYPEFGFKIQQSTTVTVLISNVLGQVVQRYVLPNVDPGEHFVRWNLQDFGGRPVPEGIYIVSIAAAGEQYAQKLMVLR